MANINFLAGKEENVNNVALQQGKVLFAVDHELNGDYTGYIYYDYFDQDAKRVIRVSMGSGGGSTANNPAMSISDMFGNIGSEVSTANVPKVTLQLPEILGAHYIISDTAFLLSEIDNILDAQGRLYNNTLFLSDPAAVTRRGWIRMLTGNEDTSTLELAAFDQHSGDNNDANQIVARLYDKDGNVTKEAILLDFDGSSRFPGPIIGNLQGNADTATKALNDDMDNEITSTYIANIKVDESTETLYSFNLLTGSNGIKDTIILQNADATHAGLLTAADQVISGNKLIDNNGSLSIAAFGGFKYLGIEESESEQDKPVWFSSDEVLGTPVIDTLFTYNATDNMLKVTNISGDYEIMSGVYGTNIKGIISHATGDEFGNEIATSYISALRDSNEIEHPEYEYIIGGFNIIGGEITTLQIPNADETTTGLVTAIDQTFNGNKTLQGYLIFPWSKETKIEDIIVGTTKRSIYDSKPYGLQGILSGKNNFFEIVGRQIASNLNSLEISVGNKGNETVYLNRYKNNDVDEPILDQTITLLDSAGGSVFKRIRLTEDPQVYKANADFSLWVDKESAFLDNIYTNKSLRFETSGDKTGIFYIVPEDTLINKYSFNQSAGTKSAEVEGIDQPYYAFLRSLIIQDNLEVNGNMILNYNLITRDIYPDSHNIYSLGKGLPELDEDDYYRNAFITNMFGNHLVIQGLTDVTDDIIDYTIPHPLIMFRENDEGNIANQIRLIYANKQAGESYLGSPVGLRLVGDDSRPWLDIDGTIYSRANNENYTRLTSNVHDVTLHMTIDGEDDYNHIARSLAANVTDDISQINLNREDRDRYIDISVSDYGTLPQNVISSVRKWAAETSLGLMNIKDGATELKMQSSENIYYTAQTLYDSEIKFHKQVSKDIFTDIKQNEEASLYFYTQLNSRNFIRVYNNETTALALSTLVGNKLAFNLDVTQEYFNLSATTDQDNSFQVYADDTNASLSLISDYMIEPYFRLGSRASSWFIHETLGGELSFYHDAADLNRFYLSRDMNTSAHMAGDAPNLNFHHLNATEATSIIRTTTPLSSMVDGTLEIMSQVVISTKTSDFDDNPTLLSSGGSGTLLVGDMRGKHVAYDNYSINAKVSHNVSGPLYLNRNGGRVFIGAGGLSINTEDNRATLQVEGTMYISDSFEIGGGLLVHKDLEVKGNTGIAGTLNVDSDFFIDGSIIPKSHDKFDLGSSDKYWNTIYSTYVYGRLFGLADESLLANRVKNSLNITMNGYLFDYDGSKPQNFAFYAPISPSPEDMYVCFWDNGEAKWGDPMWIAPEPGEGNEQYLHKLRGGHVSGPVGFGSTENYFGYDGVKIWGASANLHLQGISSSTSNTTLSLHAGYYYGTNSQVNIVYRPSQNSMVSIDQSMLISSSTKGQLRFSNSVNNSSVGAAYIDYSNNTFTIGRLNVPSSGSVSPFSPTSGGDLTPLTINMQNGIVTCSKGLYGALWNDYAEFRESKELEPGRCVYEIGDDSLARTTERLMPGGNIISDTFGFAQGQTDKAQTPIATAGRVLAYTYEDRNEFKPGDAVCTGPDGTVSLMTREEIREWPDRIVGTVSRVPDYEEWGDTPVKVNGRIWIKVR